MEINESVLQRSELYVFALRELYLKHGFSPYRMSKFEEYDLYAGNKPEGIVLACSQGDSSEGETRRLAAHWGLPMRTGTLAQVVADCM